VRSHNKVRALFAESLTNVRQDATDVLLFGHQGRPSDGLDSNNETTTM